MEPNKTTPPDGGFSPGQNIWGPKFPIYGLIIILLFLALLIGRAWYLGVPLGEVFRQAEPDPIIQQPIPDRQ